MPAMGCLSSAVQLIRVFILLFKSKGMGSQAAYSQRTRPPSVPIRTSFDFRQGSQRLAGKMPFQRYPPCYPYSSCPLISAFVFVSRLVSWGVNPNYMLELSTAVPCWPLMLAQGSSQNSQINHGFRSMRKMSKKRVEINP
jgi:hypothetical protein